VLGYPVGEEYSFARIAQQMLAAAGAPVLIEVLSYARLRHRRRLTAKCKEFQPDVLVLQMGHAELNRRMSTYLRSRCGLSTPSASKDSVIPAALVRNSATFYCKSALKRVVDVCLGHPLVDFGELEALWKVTLDEIGACSVPAVLVLSPLPCADATALYYRSRAIPVYREAAAEHGAGFVDLLSAAPRCRNSFGDCQFYYDAIHLGRLGHEQVGELLLPPLQTALRHAAAAVERARK